MLSWLALAQLAKRVLTAVITFAGRFFRALSLQGWIGLIGCAVLAFLYIRAEGESRHWHKQSNRYEQLYKAELAELQRISTAKNEQKQVTVRTIERAKVIYREAEKRAEKVETAPVAPNCGTPPEIMGADL